MSKGFSVFTVFKATDEITPTFKTMTKGAIVFSRNMQATRSQLNNFGNNIKNTFGKFNTLFNAAISFVAFDAVNEKINSFVNSASDLQETVGKTGQVFKNNSAEVENWAKTSIKSMGLAEQTALDTASLFGDMGTGMGMSTKRAAEMSMSLTQLSADLASFKNISQDMAANALKSIFTGETESLKNLGVVMMESTLQEYAQANGIRKKLKDMTQAEKIELRYQYVMKATTNAQGDFIRTFGNYANQKRVGEELKKQAEINIGRILLPVWNRFMVMYNTFFTNNLDGITKTFDKTFRYVSGLVNSFKPVFNELQKTILIFRESVGPALVELGPPVESLFKNILVPGLVLAVAGFNKLLTVFMATYNFISDNWIPIVSILAGVGGMLALKKAFDLVTAAITWYNATLMVSTTQGIAALSGIAKIKFMLSSYTAVVWQSVKAIAAQTKALFMNPWTWVAVGIAAVVAGAILVWKNWDKITEALKTFWAKCVEVFSQFKAFFQNNFIDCILAAMGPIGWIITGIRRIGDGVRGIKKDSNGGSIETNSNAKTAANQKVPTNYKQNQNNQFNGSIDVGVKIDNSTAFPASSYLNLTGNHGLTLSPA